MMLMPVVTPGTSNSLAAGIVFVIAIGFGIYYLWDNEKLMRTLKNEDKREKGD